MAANVPWPVGIRCPNLLLYVAGGDALKENQYAASYTASNPGSRPCRPTQKTAADTPSVPVPNG